MKSKAITSKLIVVALFSILLVAGGVSCTRKTTEVAETHTDVTEAEAVVEKAEEEVIVEEVETEAPGEEVEELTLAEQLAGVIVPGAIVDMPEHCQLQTIAPELAHIPHTSHITKDGVRIFWTLVIDTCLYVDSPSQLARKIISIWETEEGIPSKIKEAVFPLDVDSDSCDLAGLVPNGEIPFGGGCYLEISDPGLSNQVSLMTNGILSLPDGLSESEATIAAQSYEDIEELCNKSQESEIDSILDCSQFRTREGTNFYVGENVRLDVIFRADNNGDEHPLFNHEHYFGAFDSDSIEKHDLLVWEGFTTGNRQATWKFRADVTSAPIPDVSTESLDDLDDFHLLTVRQIQVLDDPDAVEIVEEECIVDPQPYFEFFKKPMEDFQVTGLSAYDWARSPVCDNYLHLFSNKRTILYVGYAPELVPSTLEGSIGRIIFDPNASCYGCS